MSKITPRNPNSPCIGCRIKCNSSKCFKWSEWFTRNWSNINKSAAACNNGFGILKREV